MKSGCGIILGLGALLLAGCPTEKGHGPVARMSIEPKYVPANEPTEVLLDGRRSCDEVDHPEGCDKSADGSGPSQDCPGGVTFQWSFDTPVEIIGGAVDEPVLRVQVETDRPIGVTLVVEDCSGNIGRMHGEIGVILEWPDAATGGG
jgi:hypothetical protein